MTFDLVTSKSTGIILAPRAIHMQILVSLLSGDCLTGSRSMSHYKKKRKNRTSSKKHRYFSRINEKLICKYYFKSTCVKQRFETPMFSFLFNELHTIFHDQLSLLIAEKRRRQKDRRTLKWVNVIYY